MTTYPELILSDGMVGRVRAKYGPVPHREARSDRPSFGRVARLTAVIAPLLLGEVPAKVTILTRPEGCEPPAYRSVVDGRFRGISGMHQAGPLNSQSCRAINAKLIPLRGVQHSVGYGRCVAHRRVISLSRR